MQVIIDGSTSHTHDPNRKLQAFLWEDVTSGEVVGKNEVAKCFYPFGTYTMSLTITDDAMLSLSTSQTIVVAPEKEVPGALAPPVLACVWVRVPRICWCPTRSSWLLGVPMSMMWHKLVCHEDMDS